MDTPDAVFTRDDTERVLTARLLARQLDPVTYRERMAALATVERRVSGVDPLSPIDTDWGSVEHVRRLEIALPAVSRSTLCTAVALAHNGATVENLTRLLGLTNAQALRIIITVGTS